MYSCEKRYAHTQYLNDDHTCFSCQEDCTKCEAPLCSDSMWTVSERVGDSMEYVYYCDEQCADKTPKEAA